MAWLMTATGCAPGVRLSFGFSSRPRNAGTPSIGKYSPETSWTSVGIASRRPFSRRYMRATRLIAATVCASGTARRNSVNASYENRVGAAAAAAIVPCVLRWNSSPAFFTGSDIRRSAFIAVKNMLVTPIPVASESTTAVTKPGLLRNVRNAYRTSCAKASTNGSARWSRYCSLI
jgi:hypothetical protein